ncbi:MAG: ABC transporter permease, partial [Clostridium sp.]|nr:ABC transporter permease [Clostridium sp.]
SMMFFKGGILASIYPFSAALILVGFDMSEYAGTTTAPNPLLAVIGVGIMVLWAVLLLVMSSNKKEMKARKQTKAKGRGKRAVRRKGG